jgi:putative glycerol-1-phosphate prenyltransferase
VRSVFEQLVASSERTGGSLFVLIDPDRLPEEDLPSHLENCQAAGVDAFFLGSSILYHPDFDRYAEAVQSVSEIPVVGFPGSLGQLSRHLDAMLFLSIVSSRNPEYLIGQQIHAAPVVKGLGVESIGTAYMLIESGTATSAQYVSNSMPLPRNKPDLAAATALAAEMLGMQLLFADAGSGAEKAVPVEIVEAIRTTCSRPLLVGGGLTSPESVAAAVYAGAQFVVIGNALEKRSDPGYLSDLVSAAHSSVSRLV